MFSWLQLRSHCARSRDAAGWAEAKAHDAAGIEDMLRRQLLPAVGFTDH
ncbi:MAG: hypothetical protein QF570_03640 [Myxococcota bacterium]|jgi:hypothetical protein|nr:hypothetical protein [Myxococcota bacterium]